MRTFLQATRALGLLLIAALPLGCAHHPSIVGTWSGTTQTGRATAQATFTFTEDGQETMAAQISNGPVHMSLGSTGRYAVSGASLTQTVTAIIVNGKPVPYPPNAPPKSETDQFTLNGNTLTLTKPGSPIPLVLTRQHA